MADREVLLREFEAAVREMTGVSALLSHAVAGRVGFGSTDLEALDLLVLEGPMTAGRLAERTGLSTGAVTGLVDRLPVAGEGLAPHGDPVLAGERVEDDGANGRLDPGLSVELDRALGEAPGPGMAEQVRVPLDQQRADALPGEEEGGGEADDAAADDEDGDGLVEPGRVRGRAMGGGGRHGGPQPGPGVRAGVLRSP